MFVIVAINVECYRTQPTRSRPGKRHGKSEHQKVYHRQFTVDTDLNPELQTLESRRRTRERAMPRITKSRRGTPKLEIVPSDLEKVRQSSTVLFPLPSTVRKNHGIEVSVSYDKGDIRHSFFVSFWDRVKLSSSVFKTDNILFTIHTCPYLP